MQPPALFDTLGPWGRWTSCTGPTARSGTRAPYTSATLRSSSAPVAAHPVQQDAPQLLRTDHHGLERDDRRRLQHGAVPTPLQYEISDLHQSEGEIILLVNVKPTFAVTLRERPSLFWNDLLLFLHDSVQVTVPEGGRRMAKGSITLVGCEHWPVDLLPHPSRMPEN